MLRIEYLVDNFTIDVHSNADGKCKHLLHFSLQLFRMIREKNLNIALAILFVEIITILSDKRLFQAVHCIRTNTNSCHQSQF